MKYHFYLLAYKKKIKEIKYNSTFIPVKRKIQIWKKVRNGLVSKNEENDRGEWFEIVSWKSSDSIKSDLPIKSEGRALKGFTSSHFFSLTCESFEEKSSTESFVRRWRPRGDLSKSRSIDPSIRRLTSRIWRSRDASRRISLTIDRGTQR